MGVQVYIPQKSQETSMGRRLLGIGATVAGGAFGGPAGAAAGGLIGGKIAGGSSKDALLSGLQSGVGEYFGSRKGVQAAKDLNSTVQEGANLSEKLQMPQMGESAFGRRMSAMGTSNPQVAINHGLEALTLMPPEIRQQYTPILVQADLLSRRRA